MQLKLYEVEFRHSKTGVISLHAELQPIAPYVPDLNSALDTFFASAAKTNIVKSFAVAQKQMVNY